MARPTPRVQPLGMVSIEVGGGFFAWSRRAAAAETARSSRQSVVFFVAATSSDVENRLAACRSQSGRIRIDTACTTLLGEAEDQR